MLRAFISVCLVSLSLPLVASAQVKPLLGFDAAGSERQRKLEAQFDGVLKSENLRTWMKRLSAKPHHVGSPYGKENAEFLAEQFRTWGFETEIERFDALLPVPKTRLLELVAPMKFKAALTEPVLKEDKTSGLTGQLPIYNAYSTDGDVTGELVYVNYGVPKDYETLAENGIDVKGKIVIARYGGSWRGIKPKVAAERGAIGCIIYSDPKDDGYYQGDVYPKGAWRGAQGAQRGSVADMPVYPGDPLTPGIGATKTAKRLDRKDAQTITKIPVLPISYADALPLLKAMGGPLAPSDWRGALPISYHLGAGPAKVRLKLTFDWQTVPVYNVIAKLKGSERPDEWVIRGNHHDAWVFGAADPLSGTVALMEEARAVGELTKSGWKPKRTIVYAHWDGEEPGLIGSTEYVETHAELLRKRAALYINSDSNGRGFLNIGGSHTLERFANEVARAVQDPVQNVSAHDRMRAVQIVRGTAEERTEARERADLRIGALGSGSDFTPFLQHLGVASLNIGYGGEGSGGSYHSAYDSFDHFERFIDPGFQYGIALAKTAGRLTLRAADAAVLPFEFTNFADTISKYSKEIGKLETDLREATREKNRRLEEKSLAYAADPTKPYIAPKPDTPIPPMDLTPLVKAVARLEVSARSYEQALKTRPIQSLTAADQIALDALLIDTERAMTSAQGLPRRPWYRHQIYAPGFYTGYGVKTLPAVREAMEERNWTEATAQMPVLAASIERVSVLLDRAARIVAPQSASR